MTAEHTEIQAFLNNFTTGDAPEIRKAGIVPFMQGPLRYYVMTPVATKPDLGLPDFQLCKGTRMFKGERGWEDMRKHVPDHAELEALPVTALREGIEELGLKLSNIEKFIPLGEYRFTSATNRQEVRLWMSAALVKKPEDFAAPVDSTAECKWMTLAEFNKQGRADHAHILSQMEERLAACL